MVRTLALLTAVPIVPRRLLPPGAAQIPRPAARASPSRRVKSLSLQYCRYTAAHPSATMRRFKLSPSREFRGEFRGQSIYRSAGYGERIE